MKRLIKPMEGDPKLTYTVTEMYKRLGICRALAYRLISDGSIPCIRLGKKILISKSYIDGVLENQTKM